jgi:hypothetical protein
MECFTVSQCHLDGDLYVLKSKKLPFNFMYGTIAKHSSILRYLPRNFDDFKTGSKSEPEKDDLKRQKQIEKEIIFKKQILKPLNQINCGCYEENVPMENLDLQDENIIEKNSLMEKIGEEIFFTSRFPLRMDLKPLNVIEIS